MEEHARQGRTDEFMRFLRRLRAVKQFTGAPVDQSMIEGMLEVARWSGSSGNRQPTEVVVVRDPAMRRQFGQWRAGPAASAPVVFLLVTESDAFVFDEGRMAERLLLAAAACGLGGTVAVLKDDGPEAVKPLLGIPAERRALTVVAVGHTDLSARRARPATPQARKPMTAFAHWDRF